MMEKEPKIEFRPFDLFTGTISIVSNGTLKNVKVGSKWTGDEAVYKNGSQYIEVLIDGKRAKRDDLPPQAILWLIENGYTRP